MGVGGHWRGQTLTVSNTWGSSLFQFCGATFVVGYGLSSAEQVMTPELTPASGGLPEPDNSMEGSICQSLWHLG